MFHVSFSVFFVADRYYLAAFLTDAAHHWRVYCKAYLGIKLVLMFAEYVSQHQHRLHSVSGNLQSCPCLAACSLPYTTFGKSICRCNAFRAYKQGFCLLSVRMRISCLSFSRHAPYNCLLRGCKRTYKRICVQKGGNTR